jgi:aminoglycoside phosphotransferase
MSSPSKYPSALHQLIGDSICLKEDKNRLGGSIRELRDVRGSHFFLKLAPSDSSKALHDEYARLNWLLGKLPVPEVVFFGHDDTSTYLLLSALPGRPAHRAETSDTKKTLETVAMSLRAIHAVGIDYCPFVNTLELELHEAEIAIAEGIIDSEQFISDNSGLSPEVALNQLRIVQGELVETTFTHGDFCLPNVIMDSAGHYGIVDWAGCGVADPYRDLSALDGSIRRNFGDSYVNYFFDAYGLKKSDLNRVKIDYYKSLDLFFQHRQPSG